MRTRDHRSDDHSHPDQTNYDPSAPLGPTRDAAILQVAPQHAGRLEALRARWAPRNQRPGPTIISSRPDSTL